MKKITFYMVYSLFCWLIASEASFAAQSILYYYSEPGDYIGQGAEVTFSDADGTFSLLPAFNDVPYISFNSNDGTHWWSVSMAAANGAALNNGPYENAQRWPFQEIDHPGLNFSGDGRGCNQLTGRFDVLEIVRDSNGIITKLAADFEQHCEFFEPALFGQIRYNSDVPLSGKPVRIILKNPLNSNRCVEATSPNGATINLEAKEIKDANGGNALTYNWSRTTGETSQGDTYSFVAPLTVSSQIPIGVTLTVTDLTNNSQKSVTRQICVSDTTPPSIVINSPTQGQIIQGDNLTLDVSIKDLVDKNIKQYEVLVGSRFLSPINPVTGRSKQKLFDAPKADGSIKTSITVKASDSSGNNSEQSVNVNQIPKMNSVNSYHYWKAIN